MKTCYPFVHGQVIIQDDTYTVESLDKHKINLKVQSSCLQGVVTLIAPVEPFATGIKIFDWRNFTLIA